MTSCLISREKLSKPTVRSPGRKRSFLAALLNVCFLPIAEIERLVAGVGMAFPSEALRRTFQWAAVKRSITVAVIIGTILNGINQGDALLGGQPLVIWKIILTYFVPFAVASYGSYAAFRTG